MNGELSWQERVLVVRSVAYAQTQRQYLEARLSKAQEALLSLTPPVGRGKRQITEKGALQSAAEAIFVKHRVRGLLTYTYERQSEQEVKLVGRGRAGANRPQQVIEHVRYQRTTVIRNEEAIAQFVSTLGWRAYATNAPPPRLSLEKAVRQYRDEYHIERGFGRLKGAPLSIAPPVCETRRSGGRLDASAERGCAHPRPHGVRGAPLLEAARGDSGGTLQEPAAHSHCYADGRTPLASLCAHHLDPGAVVRAGRSPCHATDSGTTAHSRFVGLPLRSLHLPRSANSTNCFPFTRMRSSKGAFPAQHDTK